MFWFRRHKMPAPHFAQGAFVLLVVVFAALSASRPVLGLSGLGTVLILSAALVEANHQRIWEGYRSRYKKMRHSLWVYPRPLYYWLNIYVVWPLILLLGIGALLAAYLSS